MSEYLIDTHCHLHDQEWFSPDQAEGFLREAAQNNVREVIVIGTDPEDSANACKFAARHDNVYWTYGIHPESAGVVSCDDNVEWLYSLFSRTYGASEEQILQKPSSTAFVKACDEGTKRVRDSSTSVTTEVENVVSGKDGYTNHSAIVMNPPVAIGEIGLDYHYEGYDRAVQIRLFEQMLQLASDLRLPVSLHIREAFLDAWTVIDNFPGVTGVVHSFTGSKKELRAALDRGFYIGVNGLATYTTPPLPPFDKMLLETDAPFLTPVPFRGTINKPGYVRNIAAYLAEKLGVAEVNIAEQTTKNARKLFNLRDANVRKS